MTNIAIDFGSTELRIYIPSKGVFTESSLIAVNTLNSQVVSVGKDAAKMFGRTGKNIKFSRPFWAGKVVDLPLAEYVFSSYIKNHGLGKFFLPAVVVAVPDDITNVEKEYLMQVLEQNGIRKISFVDNITASFLASSKTKAIMNLHIGFKSGFCAVKTADNLVAKSELKIGGDDFNKALTAYVRKKHGLAIGPQTAEFAKQEIGGVFPRDRLLTCHIKGRNIHTGFPDDIIINSDETIEAYAGLMSEIVESVQKCIDDVPDELLGDLARHGVNLSGGSANLYGMDKYLQKRLKIPFVVLNNPKDLIINGLINNQN